MDCVSSLFNIGANRGIKAIVCQYKVVSVPKTHTGTEKETAKTYKRSFYTTCVHGKDSCKQKKVSSVTLKGLALES